MPRQEKYAPVFPRPSTQLQSDLTERYRGALLDQHDLREDIRAATDACRRLPLDAYPATKISAVADKLESVAGAMLGAAIDAPEDPDAAVAPEVVRALCIRIPRSIAERRCCITR